MKPLLLKPNKILIRNMTKQTLGISNKAKFTDIFFYYQQQRGNNKN